MSRDRSEYDRLCLDLGAEEASLDAVVAALDAEGWATPTPSTGWDVRDQIGHLAVSEDLAAVAATDRDTFAVELARMLADVGATETGQVTQARNMEPAGVLAWWRETRTRTLDAVTRCSAGDRILWAAGEMSATSFVRARLMETWAHGQDIVDGLGLVRAPTQRLRHIAALGVGTRAFSYRNRDMAPPGVDVHVDLEAPDGTHWTWSPEAAESVIGTALDFCLVVTRRRRLDETGLVTTGPAAHEWMEIAQAFAGPPS